MAYTFSVNNSPTTGAVAMYTLISTLISAGWTKVADSDGTTYSALGTQVTSGAAGTNGLGNTNAWVRLQAPAVNGKTREFIFQRGTTNLTWKVKYSAYGGFIGGLPTATATPCNETSYAYSEANQDATTAMYSVLPGTGQSFTTGIAATSLIAAKFFLKKTGVPTGFAVAKVYAHSGTIGISSIPTGAALATSVPFDVSTLTASYALTELKFTGSNSITLDALTDYVVTIEYSGGSGVATLDVGRDGSSPTATGNSSTYNGTTWTAVSTSDLCGYVLTGIQDEVYMWGGGTDVTPTFFGQAFTTDAVYRWHIAAGGAAEFYSFVAWSQTIGSLVGNTSIALDVMATGSFPSADVDPAVVYCNSGVPYTEIVSSAFSSTTTTNSAKARAWLGPVSAAGASLTTNNVGVSMLSYGNTVIGNSGTLGGNPWVNSDDLLPCLWGCANTYAPRGLKGFSTLFMMGTVNRANGDTSDTVSPGSKDKIYYGYFWLPWSGAVPLI